MSPRALAVFVALAALSQARLIGVEAYDPDEFEHLHAGLMFAQGSVPYRDFFEHHGPLPYLLAWLPAKLIGPSTTLLTANRWISFFFSTMTGWAAYRLAIRVAGKKAAGWALVWLLTLPWFLDKSLEWRPDVPAMAFVTLGALAAADRRVSLAGLFIGLATLCTPKAAMLSFCLALALLIHSPTRARTAIRFLTGFFAPWFVAAVAFAAAGGLSAFLWCLFYLPAVWPMRVWVGRDLFAIALDHGPASLAMGIAAWCSCWKVGLSSPRRRAWDVIRIPVILHWLSLPFVPAAYMQFHLLGLPLLAVAVARLLPPVILGVHRSAPRHVISGVVLIAVVGFALGALFRFRHRPLTLPDQSFVAAAGLTIFVLAIWRPMLIARRPNGTLWLGAALLLAPNLGWLWLHHDYLPRMSPVTRQTQIAAIEELGRLLPHSARIQDGFTGVGCLHRSADYWWWINEHSVKLLDKLGELAKFRARLKLDPPDAYLVDNELRKALLPIETNVAGLFDEVADDDALRFKVFLKKPD